MLVGYVDIADSKSGQGHWYLCHHRVHKYLLPCSVTNCPLGYEQINTKTL
jgi:hypothetical protein